MELTDDVLVLDDGDEFAGTVHELTDEQLEAFRPFVDEAFRDLSTEELRPVVAELLGDVPDEALPAILGAITALAPVITPLIGKAIGGLTRRRRRTRARRPVRRPVRRPSASIDGRQIVALLLRALGDPRVLAALPGARNQTIEEVLISLMAEQGLVDDEAAGEDIDTELLNDVAEELVEHEAGIEGTEIGDALESVALLERIIQKISGDADAVVRFRAGVRFTEAFPYSAVCQLRLEMVNGGRRTTGLGTGFYIGRNILLTAGHNIIHPRFGTLRTGTGAAGRIGSRQPYGSFRFGRSNAVVHPNYRPGGDGSFDLAVIAVDRPAPRGRTFTVSALSDSALRRPTPVAVAGYAADRSAGVDPNQQNLDYDIIRTFTRETMRYSLHTTGGTSGSPVWLFHPVHRVVGVHVQASGSQHNKCCRLTTDKLAWIRRSAQTLGRRTSGQFALTPAEMEVFG